MIKWYRVVLEPVEFNDQQSLLVPDYDPLLRVIPPLPVGKVRNRGGLLQAIRVPMDSRGLADVFLEAQRVYNGRWPLWDGKNRQATEIRFGLPLPTMPSAEELELMTVYARAMDQIAQRGHFYGGEFVAILADRPDQTERFEALCRPADDARQLQRLLNAGMTYDHSLLESELRELSDPLPYLVGMRPFFEQGRGDITAESGYPRLRNFHKLFDRNKAGLTALAGLCSWRAAFDQFERRFGYSACPADWKVCKSWPIATKQGLKAYVNDMPSEFRR